MNHARQLEEERGAELILPVLLEDIEPALALPEAAPVAWLREFLNRRIYADLRDPEKYGVGTKLLIQSAREKYSTLVWRD